MIKALVLRTAGTNCDQETLHALKLGGAEPHLRHLREILSDGSGLSKYRILVIPGGFSYGDDVAAGKILANELRLKLKAELAKFVDAKRLVIGVCNGFQVLVKAGLLPGDAELSFDQTATLTQNDSGRFQCEWVPVKKEKSRAGWLSALPLAFDLPIAHGEGKFISKNQEFLKHLEKNRQVILRYSPGNPNGSTRSIAGICNESGNVVGLMPHPERYVTSFQHPAWTSMKAVGSTAGYLFWQGAVKYARSLS
ncbi:MAG: phosphoribosylformylglycinamidine synthase I [Elusimicrobia bacterium RIFCSPLOWO2_01_FULL_54_10]|nr:MAG: phosphoribosylformylglycinamidine synthase I [Elusimicrobia bacterium RIFCSPLOWO2_01_FULL_54_10]